MSLRPSSFLARRIGTFLRVRVLEIPVCLQAPGAPRVELRAQLSTRAPSHARAHAQHDLCGESHLRVLLGKHLDYSCRQNIDRAFREIPLWAYQRDLA